MLRRSLLLLALLLVSGSAVAQEDRQMFMRNKDRPVVGPKTTVEPKDCQTAEDGTITCGTTLVNPKDPANRYRTVDSPTSP
jgi:hypothetical protein